MAATANITTGQCVGLDSSGNAVLAGTSGVIVRGLFVAIETQDNSGGSAGDLNIRLAGGNTYVYATASEALVVGHSVKSSTSSKVASTTDPTVRIGTFIGHENEDVAQTDAVTDDVIIVRLGL